MRIILVTQCYLHCFLSYVSQAIDHTFHRRTMLVAESINQIVQFLSFKALNAIAVAKVNWLWQGYLLSVLSLHDPL